MSGDRSIFDLLRIHPDPAADAALIVGMGHADVTTRQAIVETLLTRGTREALHGLVQSFHLLDEPLRQAVLVEWEQLYGMLREASLSRSRQTRINVLEIIRRACIYRASYLTESALRHSAPEVRKAAADTLCFLADELIRTAPVPPCSGDLAGMSPEELRDRMTALENYTEDRRQLISTIETAVAAFDVHHQAQVVEAATWFADELSPAFWTLLTMPGSRITKVVIASLNKAMGPRHVPFAMTALGFAELRSHVLKVLTEGADPLFIEEWVRQSWRLVQPKLARPMASLKHLACLDKDTRELLELPPASQRHLARWISATGLGNRQKIDLLRQLQQVGAQSSRRSALWALTGINDIQIYDTLRQIEDPEDPEAENIARREIARRFPLEMPISRLLTLESWSACDRNEGRGEMTFEAYWQSFDGMTEARRVESGRRLKSRAPLLDSKLAGKLDGPDLFEQVRAVRVIAACGLADHFQERLYKLCHSPQAELRSAAVTALARVETPVSKRLLQKALADSDHRVQANAVESIATVGGDSVIDDLLDKLGSTNNRVQANAVKALLKLGVRQAAEALFRMLQHDNRMHRMSALWLIERMGLFSLATRVASLATADPDPVVRQRAARLSHHLPVRPGVEETAAPTTATDKARGARS